MSQFYKCDRCGQIIESGTEEFLTLPMRKMSFDLCSDCWQEFKVFINNKGRIHLFKRVEPF